MPAPEEVRTLIEGALPDAEVTVADLTGGGDHFRVDVTSASFAGMPRLEQHRTIYAAVDAQLKSGEIHALSIGTSVPSS